MRLGTCGRWREDAQTGGAAQGVLYIASRPIVLLGIDAETDSK
jgi:hypothetical protein